MPTRSPPEAGLAGDELVKVSQLPRRLPGILSDSRRKCQISPELAQDALEDAAVLEVGDLVRRVEADPRLEADRLGALALLGHGYARRLPVLDIRDVEDLLAGQPEALDALAV